MLWGGGRGRRLDSLDGEQGAVERPSGDNEEVTIGAGVDEIKLIRVIVFEILPLIEAPSDNEAVLPSTVAVSGERDRPLDGVLRGAVVEVGEGGVLVIEPGLELVEDLLVLAAGGSPAGLRLISSTEAHRGAWAVDGVV